VHGSVVAFDPDDYPIPAQYSLLQCTHCQEPLVEWREDYGGGFEADDPVFKYPARRMLSFDIPEALRNEYDEARQVFTAKAYRATLVMVRRVLEGTCQDQGAKKRTLAASLKELEAQGKIDGMLAEWADLLRVVGNEGAHFGSEPTREDALDALDFGEALLDHLYVLRKRFADFKQRRPTK
jgi:hypothetical protein